MIGEAGLLTVVAQDVLAALLEEPVDGVDPLTLSRQLRLSSRRLRPALAHLERMGWVESDWHDRVGSTGPRGPRRRHYRLTDPGRERATAPLVLTAQRRAAQLAHAKKS